MSGIVLQRFNIIGLYGNATVLFWKVKMWMFYEWNWLALLLCCILCCLPASQVDLTRFRLVTVFGVSTAKRKTRPHTGFRSARYLKRINPLKITLLPQFHRIKAEMPEMPVSSLATQFNPQRVRYEAFVLSQLCFGNSKEARPNCLEHYGIGWL